MYVLFQIIDSGKINGTDGTSSMRAFDQCHICLRNHKFDLFMI